MLKMDELTPTVGIVSVNLLSPTGFLHARVAGLSTRFALRLSISMRPKMMALRLLTRLFIRTTASAPRRMAEPGRRAAVERAESWRWLASEQRRRVSIVVQHSV